MAPGTPLPEVTGKEMNWSEEEVGFSAGSRSDCRAGPGHGVSAPLDMAPALRGLFDIYELHQYLRHCSKHHSMPESMRLQS